MDFAAVPAWKQADIQLAFPAYFGQVSPV